MCLQVLLHLCEVYPAVHMAKKAVHLKPNWWIGLQTLGRAQLGLGEVHLVGIVVIILQNEYLILPLCLFITTTMIALILW